ncbi:MAG: PAS domain S-box protein [Chloroflexi bacterium]|nr:PAS domain S-box protein [Chloroflexota bacterium]
MEIVTYTVMVSGVVLVYHFHRSAVERTRLHELQTAYQRVRQSEIELERRVEERTRQLRASELNWRTLTVNSPDTIIRITPDRRVSFFQHPLLTVEGNEQALVGYPILDLYLPETRQSLSDALDRTFATGELQEVEVLGILDPSAETQALFQNRIIPPLRGADYRRHDRRHRHHPAQPHGRIAPRPGTRRQPWRRRHHHLRCHHQPRSPRHLHQRRRHPHHRLHPRRFRRQQRPHSLPLPRETPEFQRLRASFRDRIACNALVPAVRKDGTTFWSEIWQSPVSDDSGTVTHFVSTLLDVTDRVVAQHNQSQLLEQLEVSNRDLRDFAYIVSHDLRAPLRGIGSIAAWLVADYADRLDDDGRRLLELLRGRVQRMDALISGILEYSRIGRTHEQLQTVDIGHLVAQVVDEIVPPAAFDVSISPDLPHLSVEPIHLRQVFQNLLANAVACYR